MHCASQGVVYAFEEDERLTTAFICVYKRKVLPDKHVVTWLDALEKPVKGLEEQPDNTLEHVNLKNLCRCVYFRMMHEGLQESLVIEALKPLCKYRWVG